MNQWFQAPVDTTGKWVALIALIVVVPALAMRTPVLKKLYPGR